MGKNNLEERLRKVLEKKPILESYYSIGEYKEGASCIEEMEEGYIVYNAERAEKNEKEEFETYGEAAYELISRITKTKEDKKEIQQEFFEEVMKECLEEVLISHDVLHCCSLDGYAEEAVCMEKIGTEYMVYIGERGNKHEVTKHKMMASAFCEIISKLAESTKEEGKMRIELMREVSDKTKR